VTSPALPGGNHPAVAGRLVSVATLVAAVHRRWRLCAAGAVLGAIAGAAFSVASPPPHTATTTLFLQHPTSSDKARAIMTDAKLAQSRSVAHAAITSLGLHSTVRELVDQYQPTILSDDLLQIKVRGPSDKEAVRRAEGVAASFLGFRRDEVQRESTLAIQDLEERQRQLNAELLQVTDGINARTGVKGDEALRALGDLLVRRATLNDKLGTVRQRIESSSFDSDAIVQKSRVVDPAGLEDRSPLKLAVVNVAAGIVLGLLLPTALIVMQEATTDRLRRREDVAVALGAPVAAGIGGLWGPMWFQRQRFTRLLATPPPALRRAVGRLRETLDEDGGQQRRLVLVSVDSDGAAALVLASTTAELVDEEKSVLVVDLTRSNVLARLTKAPPEGTDRLPLIGSGSALWVSFAPDQLPQLEARGGSEVHRELIADVDVLLTLATVDPAIGARHLRELAGTAVVVATAGRSSEVALRSVSQLIEDAGLKLHSTILVGADERDESVGLEVWRSTEPRAVAPRLWFNQ